jgi:hypothetical protein
MWCGVKNVYGMSVYPKGYTFEGLLIFGLSVDNEEVCNPS